ncbi:hypothetical protein [Inconstantimicrobium porci]|uniref:hypothetical protein n=1 Tax=Inconstantimicrobium porci TaxID=2652291 RepID=UPI0024091FE1|nr:hypothetical protein [Inconstantimicrobium porci]MDD6771371.1 hypothetical protein [Inconstantimicrobium porci]
MKYFIIEGIITNPELMNDETLKEHISYTNKEIEKGNILFTSLKSDNSGGMFMIKADTKEYVENYLSNEPLNNHGIQEYKITEITPHYINLSAKEWFV